MMKNDHLPRPQNNCHQKFCHSALSQLIIVVSFGDHPMTEHQALLFETHPMMAGSHRQKMAPHSIAWWILVLPFFDGVKLGIHILGKTIPCGWFDPAILCVCMLACISPPNDGFSTLAFRTYPCAPTPGS